MVSTPLQKTILVAEDSVDTRAVLCGTLAYQGYRVVEAADGEAAVGPARRAWARGGRGHTPRVPPHSPPVLRVLMPSNRFSLPTMPGAVWSVNRAACAILSAPAGTLAYAESSHERRFSTPPGTDMKRPR